jgi:hypothetical protein
LLIGDLGWSLRERSVQELFKVHLMRFQPGRHAAQYPDRRHAGA